MGLIGELALGKNRSLKIYDDVKEHYGGEKFPEELNQVVPQLSIITTDVQLVVTKTRVQPVAKVSNKFPRAMGDLSRRLEKQIKLEITGEETELDKSIVEETGDPIMHMIRNSCDHGVEDPATRKANGRSERGAVQLKAYNEGNHIVAEIADDGKGFDTTRLKMKALEKNLITEKEAKQMTDKETSTLIFKPDFSAAAKITSASGRGVNMDVVKANIEKLNGIIEIDSELGEGNTSKLKIPFISAITQSLLVRIQEGFYAILLASVLETVRMSTDNIYTIKGKSVLCLREEALSLVRFSDVFGAKQAPESGDQTCVVIIDVAESKLGIIVDTLAGQEGTVIKSMGGYLQNIQDIVGATIRDGGRVAPIVDVGAIMGMAKEIKVGIRAQLELSAKRPREQPSDYKVLIIDGFRMDRTLTQKALEPLDIGLPETANGVEALNVVKSGRHEVDAMLIDIEMPRMDGYTLVGRIHKYSKYRNLPFIAVTLRTNKTDRLRGVEAGMAEYITKPYSPEYLENVVCKSLKLE